LSAITMIGDSFLTQVAWLACKHSRQCRWETRRQFTWASTAHEEGGAPGFPYTGRHRENNLLINL